MKQKRIFRILTGIGIFLSAAGGNYFLGTAQEALAATSEPTVSNLTVIDTGNGISAQCDYAGYAAGSDYDIQLYLDKWNGDTRSTVKFTILDKDDTGTGRTDAVMAESGIYSAAAVIRDNVTAESTARYYETEKYRVIKTDSGYQITKLQADHHVSVRTNAEQADVPEELSPVIICEHIFEEIQISDADPDHDAIVGMQCESCGAMKDYYEVPNSAYAYFQRESAQKILNAAAGGEVVISTARWISFHHMVTDAMAQRPDVTIIVVYRYKGLDDTIIIPAGADRSGFANDDGYCGFLYLKQMLL